MVKLVKSIRNLKKAKSHPKTSRPTPNKTKKKAKWKKCLRKLTKLSSIQDYELFVYFLAFAAIVVQCGIVIMGFSKVPPVGEIYEQTLQPIDEAFEGFGLLCYVLLWISSIVLKFGWVICPLLLIPVHWVYLVYKLCIISIHIIHFTEYSAWRLLDLLPRIIIYPYIFVVSVGCADALRCATYTRYKMDINQKTEAAFVVSRRVALRYTEQLRIKHLLPWAQLRSEALYRNCIVPKFKN